MVAGTDGSPGSYAAIGFAFEEANAWGLPLRVIYSRADAGAEFGRRYFGAALAQHAAHGVLSSTLRPWQERFPLVAVCTTLSSQAPDTALLEAASSARLVVTSLRSGHRRNEAHPGALARTLLERAPCPIAIVPGVCEGLRVVA